MFSGTLTRHQDTQLRTQINTHTHTPFEQLIGKLIRMGEESLGVMLRTKTPTDPLQYTGRAKQLPLLL